MFFCHPQLDWGSSLNQCFWIPDQDGNDIKKLVQKFQMFGRLGFWGLNRYSREIRVKGKGLDKRAFLWYTDLSIYKEFG